MAKLWALLLLGLLALGAEGASSGGKKKRTKPDRMAEARIDGLNRLHDGNYTRYLGSAPRQHHAMVLFTAAGPQFGCQPCPAVEAVFAEVAAAYDEQSEGVAPGDRLFFAVVDVSSARGVFSEFQLQTVPHIAYMPVLDKGADHVKAAQMLPLPPSKKDLQSMIHDVSGVEIIVFEDPSHKHAVVAAVAAAVAVGAHLLMSGALLALARSRWVWLSVSMLVYGGSISGLAYCVIKDSPAFGGWGRQLTFFSNQGRDQFVLEGLSIGALMLVLTAFTVVAWKLMGYRGRLGWLRQLGATMMLAAVIFVLVQLYFLYQFKTAWYNVLATLPRELYAALQGKVRRNSPFWRRALRAANVWLNEFEGLAAYGARFQQIMLP